MGFFVMLSRLEDAFESQRRFIANASHELRTPLTIMRTELEVTLDNGTPDVAELRAMGEVVRAAVNRSERLVDGLLALAESERGLARTEELNLAVLARSAVARADRELTVTQELAPAQVLGTRVLLDQLMELGLSIVRAVARAHGGDATAEPLPGGGLRVTVTLPADPAACRRELGIGWQRPGLSGVVPGGRYANNGQ